MCGSQTCVHSTFATNADHSANQYTCSDWPSGQHLQQRYCGCWFKSRACPAATNASLIQMSTLLVPTHAWLANVSGGGTFNQEPTSSKYYFWYKCQPIGQSVNVYWLAKWSAFVAERMQLTEDLFSICPGCNCIELMGNCGHSFCSDVSWCRSHLAN